MIVNPIRIFATLFVAAVGVSAQSTDTCINTCLTSSLSNDTCTSATNTSCICVSTAYQAAVAECLTANCTAADLATAKALEQSQCGSSSNSSNSSTTTGSSSSSSRTPTTTSPTPSSSSTKSSGAIHDQVPFLKAALTLATVALGGAFLL
ncbi:hypothetical protein EI94DRAFT_1801047 [Lactarius quietus]|nr:hypothetical protein EI94DRAFT_1801047 [Lactarius quietus]